MHLHNSTQAYGLISKLFHWIIAIGVISLFGIGVWMVELDYYSAWYRDAPFYHKSTGIVIASLMLARLIWRWREVQPQPLDSHSKFEKTAAHITHIAIYALVFLIAISGYLISTADGRGISVFGWFEVPALGELVNNQEDIGGLIHQWLAYSLIGLVVLHAVAAIKHHLVDKDLTLKRMI